MQVSSVWKTGVVALVMAAVLAACDKTNPAAPTAPSSTNGAISFVFITGAAPPTGGTAQMAARAVMADGANIDVTSQSMWRSSNPAVVTVSGSGLVSGVAAGTAELSATYQNVTATTAIAVRILCHAPFRSNPRT